MDNSKGAGWYCVMGSYATILAFAGFLLFYHLDNHRLWADEGETAMLAKNVMQFGVPRTFDGTNYILLHNQKDENQAHIWIWSPWLQEYVAAGSFVVFGLTTWAARAPFALVGWCSLVVLALVAWKIYRSHWVALASMVLLGTSEVFLLHARQCRYYPISVFAEIMLVYGSHQLFVRNRRGVWLMAFALILQFYSNYIVMAANLPAVLFLAWMLRQQGNPARLRVAAVLGVLTVAVLPWLVYAHPWGQAGAAGEGNYFGKARWYLTEFHFHFIPLCFLLLPLLGLIRPGPARPAAVPEVSFPWERLWLFLLPSYVAVLLVAPGYYLRYLLPLLPVACLLAAAWIFRYIKWCAPAVLLVAVLALSNAGSMVTAYPFRGTHNFRLPLWEYVPGMAVPYTDCLADMVDFFGREAQPRDMILSFDPEFPLRFYTRLTVIDGVLMAPPRGRLPDWILPVGASSAVAQDAVALPDFLKPYYETITTPVHNSFRAGSIPEPDLYQYRSVPALAPFVIYKLKAGTNDQRFP